MLNYMLRTASAYLQDTFTRNRLTVKLGLRWDRQWNEALASAVPAHPFAAQWLPAVQFDGADGGVVWNDISPRVGFTCDLLGDSRTVLSGSWAIDCGQRAPNQGVAPLNPVTAATIRSPGPTPTVTASSRPANSTTPACCRSGGTTTPTIHAS